MGVQVAQGRYLEIDASGSYDPDGSIVKYEWDFEGDGTYEYYETASNHPDGEFDGKHERSYSSAGTYTAKVRVKDNDGLTSLADTCTVHAVKIEVDSPVEYPAWLHVERSYADYHLDLDSTLTPAGATGGTYTWSKDVGAGTMTFSPSGSVADPELSVDKPGEDCATDFYL